MKAARTLACFVCWLPSCCVSRCCLDYQFPFDEGFTPTIGRLLSAARLAASHGCLVKVPPPHAVLAPLHNLDRFIDRTATWDRYVEVPPFVLQESPNTSFDHYAHWATAHWHRPKPKNESFATLCSRVTGVPVCRRKLPPANLWAHEIGFRTVLVRRVDGSAGQEAEPGPQALRFAMGVARVGGSRQRRPVPRHQQAASL